MPLVPHPPSVARADLGEEQGGPPARLSSGGGRPRDVNSFALAQKAGLPTLNFVKLKQDTKADLEQALALGGASGAGSGGASQRNTLGNAAISARARQYSSGGGGGRQYSSGGGAGQPSGSSQGARPPQAPNAGSAPVRRVMAAGVAQPGTGALMPHPPAEKGFGHGGGGGGEIPERNKVEPTHPLTARNQPIQDGKSNHSEPAQRQPMTARPAESAHEQQSVAPQKYVGEKRRLGGWS